MKSELSYARNFEAKLWMVPVHREQELRKQARRSKTGKSHLNISFRAGP